MKESKVTCFLDLNYSSTLLSTKIADIPHKLKYETILAPIFEYCFGTSDQDQIWEELTEEEKACHDLSESNNSSTIINLKIDWIRDETFIYSKIFNLVAQKVDILARKFGLWNNRKFILNYCSILKIMNADFYTKEEFKSDRELLLAIVKENGYNLKYASDELRNDKEIVKQAVKRNGLALEYASEKMKDDKEILFIALESMDYAYIYASERLKNDRDVVLKAVSLGLPVSDVRNSEKFNNDRELLLLSSKINGHATLKFACYELRNDKEIVLQSIQQNPFVFLLASDELKKDREFVKEIVMTNAYCLQYASRVLQDDKEIVELALKSNPDAIHFISGRLRSDTEFISNLIGKRGFYNIPTKFSNDIEIVLNSIKIREANFEKASTELQNDREFILQAVKNNGKVLEFVNEEFKSDREIILEAVTQNGDAVEFVPNQFMDDEEILLKAAHTATKNVNFVNKLSDRLKNDREFLMKCGYFFYYFPRKYQLDRQVVMEVLKTNYDPVVLYYAYPLTVYDRVLVMRMVKRDGLLLGKLPSKYRNDREIVVFAIQQNKEAFKFASEDVQSSSQHNTI